MNGKRETTKRGMTQRVCVNTRFRKKFRRLLPLLLALWLIASLITDRRTSVEIEHKSGPQQQRSIDVACPAQNCWVAPQRSLPTRVQSPCPTLVLPLTTVLLPKQHHLRRRPSPIAPPFQFGRIFVVFPRRLQLFPSRFDHTSSTSFRCLRSTGRLAQQKKLPEEHRCRRGRHASDKQVVISSQHGDAQTGNDLQAQVSHRIKPGVCQRFPPPSTLALTFRFMP